MPELRYVFVDVFTQRALEGNQLAVFTDARGLDEETMQRLALEIGFSETVFVLPAEAGGTARVRIFTPGVELPFAGHPISEPPGCSALLSSAIASSSRRAGVVPVELERDESGAIVFGRMEQPLPDIEPYPDPEALLRALGSRGRACPSSATTTGCGTCSSPSGPRRR